MREKQNTPTNTPTQNQFTNSELKQIEEMEAVIESIESNAYTLDWGDNARADAEKISKVLYTAGYRKQSEGEWKYPPYAPFGGSYEMKRCSICGYKPDFDSDNPYTKFCPNCGAKMKGGAE